MRTRRVIWAVVAGCAALALTTGGATEVLGSPASAASSPTSWSALDKAIHRIPSYRPGVVQWVVTADFGYWGTADWYDNVLYIDPTVPLDRIYDVAVHEWSHELSVLDYGG